MRRSEFLYKFYLKLRQLWSWEKKLCIFRKRGGSWENGEIFFYEIFIKNNY